jgi:anti-anti-sigma factor
MGLSKTTRNGNTQSGAVKQSPEAPPAGETGRDGAGSVSWRGRKHLLEVQLEIHGRSAVLRLHGSVGITEAAALRVALDNLIHRGASAIVLDLSGLHYVAPVAASAIVADTRSAKLGGERIRLASPSPGVLDVLIRIGVSACVAIYPSVAAAMETASVPGAPGWISTRRSSSTGRRRKRTELPIRIPVTYEAMEPILAVPVRKHLGSARRRLVARIVWEVLTGGALPRPA